MTNVRVFFRAALALLIVMTCPRGARAGEPRGADAAIHQVGLVWLKSAGDANSRQKVIDAVHEFARSIPEVRSATVGEPDGIAGPFSDTTFDLCFILTFKSEEARQRYAKHPVHEKAAKEVFLPLAKKLLFYRFVAR